LAHLKFYFFHLARPQKGLPIPGLAERHVKSVYLNLFWGLGREVHETFQAERKL
jgi:hypothetical protein